MRDPVGRTAVVTRGTGGIVYMPEAGQVVFGT
jgi:hypothetical protein